jgi:ABC-type oligopeptide transport system ATPase subunit
MDLSSRRFWSLAPGIGVGVGVCLAVHQVRDLKQFFPIQKGFMPRTVAYIKAVNEVSLTINKGETFGLVGESGCGQSTLGCSILRLCEPTGGEVDYAHQHLRECHRWQRE